MDLKMAQISILFMNGVSCNNKGVSQSDKSSYGSPSAQNVRRVCILISSVSVVACCINPR